MNQLVGENGGGARVNAARGSNCRTTTEGSVGLFCGAVASAWTSTAGVSRNSWNIILQGSTRPCCVARMRCVRNTAGGATASRERCRMMQHRRPHTRAQRGNRPSMRRLLLVSAVFLLAALVAVGTQFSALVLWAMRPGGPV